MLSEKIVAIGASSSIVISCLRRLTTQKSHCVLVGRDEVKLMAVKKDLISRTEATVDIFVADLIDSGDHNRLVKEVVNKLGNIDLLLIGHGHLPNQQACEKNHHLTLDEISINMLSTISLLTIFSNVFIEQKQGSIAVIVSVAGDRGRQSNYVYGCAKSGLQAFLSGLRNRLYHQNIHVLTINPGFVNTPMTSNIEKSLLFVEPEVVAKDICLALKNRKDILYTPWFWRFIMQVIRNIPEFIFKRLKL